MNTLSTTLVSSRSLVHRLAVFGYGVAAYVFGVAALLAVILTMLGVLPFTGGPLGTVSFGAGLTLNLLLLVAFALQPIQRQLL